MYKRQPCVRQNAKAAKLCIINRRQNQPTSSPLLVTRDSSAMRGTAYLPPSRHGVHSPLSNDLCRSRRFLCALARRQVASTSRLYSASFLPARPTLTPAFTSSEIVNFISIVVSRRMNRLCEYCTTQGKIQQITQISSIAS